MSVVNVVEGGLEPCQAVPTDFLKKLLKEKPASQLVKRGYAIFRTSSKLKTTVNALHAEQDAFFKSDLDTKMKYVAGSHKVETLGYSAVVGLKEYYQIRLGGADTHIQYPPKLGKVALEAYCQLDIEGQKQLDALFQHFDIHKSDKAIIDNMIDPNQYGKAQDETGWDIQEEEGCLYSPYLIPGYISSSNLDLFHYSNDADTRAQWRYNHGTHSDSGIISLIPCSPIPALEFLDQKLKQWIAIEQIIHDQAPALGLEFSDFGITMAGDTLQFAISEKTKPHMKAGMHRVERTDGTTRCSIIHKLRGRPIVVGTKYQVDFAVTLIQEDAIKANTNA